MMNYLAQYTVLEYRLPSKNKCEMLKNTKVLGVFEADDEYKRVVNISLIDTEAEPKEVLFFNSKAGGGANFPRLSKVYEATMQKMLHVYLYNL